MALSEITVEAYILFYGREKDHHIVEDSESEASCQRSFQRESAWEQLPVALWEHIPLSAVDKVPSKAEGRNAYERRGNKY
jgi:hypothetical protein